MKKLFAIVPALSAMTLVIFPLAEGRYLLVYYVVVGLTTISDSLAIIRNAGPEVTVRIAA